MVKKLEIDRDEFQRIVTDLESRQTLSNPTALWKALETTDWAKALRPRPLTASVAGKRAKELGIQYKTEPAKRGLGVFTEEQKAAMQAARKNRKPRSEKMKAFAGTFAGMRGFVPKRFLPAVDQAEKGSLRAAIKLTCLDCSAYQPGEIKLCPITVCGLFPHRPYQGSVEDADHAIEPDDGDNDDNGEADQAVEQVDDSDE